MLPRLGSWIFHMCSFLSSLRENNRSRSMYQPKFTLDSSFSLSLSLARLLCIYLWINDYDFHSIWPHASDLEYLCLCASCSRMSSSSVQQVRPVIECFSQFLSLYEFSPITSETFRLAKFNRDEAVRFASSAPFPRRNWLSKGTV